MRTTVHSCWTTCVSIIRAARLCRAVWGDFSRRSVFYRRGKSPCFSASSTAPPFSRTVFSFAPRRRARDLPAKDRPPVPEIFEYVFMQYHFFFFTTRTTCLYAMVQPWFTYRGFSSRLCGFVSWHIFLPIFFLFLFSLLFFLYCLLLVHPGNAHTLTMDRLRVPEVNVVNI